MLFRRVPEGENNEERIEERSYDVIRLIPTASILGLRFQLQSLHLGSGKHPQQPSLYLTHQMGQSGEGCEESMGGKSVYLKYRVIPENKNLLLMHSAAFLGGFQKPTATITFPLQQGQFLFLPSSI